MKIDAVITWVNGDDPVHKVKRTTYAGGAVLKSEDKAGETRYVSVGEIYWCIASLNRFAPWLNKIYIVTDEQNPQLDQFLASNFPDGHVPVEIIDHKVIFRGYEEYLPTFNSLAIETMTWRIPGLSNHYIELNDDMFFTGPVLPQDFFTEDGTAVWYVDKINVFWTWFTRIIKSKSQGLRKVTFKGVMFNAARILGKKWTFFKINHTPRALFKDVYEEFFRDNDELLRANISHRFRDASQFSPQVLHCHLLDSQGRCSVRPVKGNHFFFQPKKGQPSYFDKKMTALRSFRGNFVCLNSIDLATEEQRRTMKNWIEERLSVRL